MATARRVERPEMAAGAVDSFDTATLTIEAGVEVQFSNDGAGSITTNGNRTRGLSQTST